MAPSSTRMRIYEAFHVAEIPLAVLLSLTVPAVLCLLISAFNSTLFISLLSHFWTSLMSWVTPPCLFVLLNGIIVLLTATSGTFTSLVAPAEEGGDFHAPLLEAMEDAQSLQSSLSTEVEGLLGKCGQGDEKVDTSFATIDPGEDYGNDDADDEKYEDAEEEEHPSRMLRVSLPSNAFLPGENPLLCPEMGRHDRVTGGSEPSSPQCVTPSKSSSIKRSLSIDSSPFHGNQPIPSVEQLSDEAFKKRVEDFIARMNAQLKSEVKKKNCQDDDLGHVLTSP